MATLRGNELSSWIAFRDAAPERQNAGETMAAYIQESYREAYAQLAEERHDTEVRRLMEHPTLSDRISRLGYKILGYF